MTRTATAAAAAGAVGLGALPELVSAVPAEWGPIGAAAVVALWYAGRLHDAAMSEIRGMREDIARAAEAAAGRAASIARNAARIEELRERSRTTWRSAQATTATPEG